MPQVIGLTDRYALMRNRAEPYRGSANWAFILVVLGALWYGFNIIFTAAFSLWSQSPRVVTNPDVIDQFIAGSTPAAVRWSLAAFALYTIMLVFMIRAMHGIGLRAMIGKTSLALRQFGRISLYLSPFYLFLILPSIFSPEAYQQYGFATWIAMLPMMLPLLFIQISAEELVFRGYLQSHLAALVNSPIVWIGVPSLLFGLIHYDPYAPSYSAWSYVVWASVLGVVCADVTARSGTLGPAFAIHFVNNIGALLVLAADDWLYGAALFVWPMYGQAWEPWIPFEALVLLCVWLIARLALRR